MSEVISNVTAKTATAAMNRMVKADVTLQDDSQAYLLFALQHFGGVVGDNASMKKSSGDSRYLKQLLNIKAKTVRINDISVYITKHTNLRVSWDKDASEYVLKVDPTNKTRRIALPTNEDGTVMAWFDFTPATIQAAFDLDARINALIKTATKVLTGGKDVQKLKGTKAHVSEQIAGLKALVS